MSEQIVFCKGGGCTAKLGPGILEHVLERLPKGNKDANLLIGYDSHDDAAVYKISDELAIVQTLDFFPPMIDDPYTFGQIAATNALSDIYAMFSGKNGFEYSGGNNEGRTGKSDGSRWNSCRRSFHCR